MNKSDFEKALKGHVQNSPDNYVKSEVARRPELAGMCIFNEPLIGYASAADTYFTEVKKPDIIGAHFMTPEEWLADAKTVISIFLPFSGQIRKANGQDMKWPADEWLHGRFEGQSFQNMTCDFVVDLLKKEGYSALAPMTDPRFLRGNPVIDDKTKDGFYSSNWSERHVAYAAGLGTFGLSKSLITLKGTAGRYLSIITTAFFEPDKRPYSDIYEYCNFCGTCASNCPTEAISREGKKHYPCSEFLDITKEKYKPYYGCGKCQVKVPCEFEAPNA